MISDRAQGWRVTIVVMAFVAALILFGTFAKATGKPLPDGWTCHDVRYGIERHGRAVAYALALAHGLTPSQIKEIRQRCKV